MRGGIVESQKNQTGQLSRDASGRGGLPSRIVSPEPCAKAEACAKAANLRFFEKTSFF
jgi:hypothetical protein